jgi:hypothetical protein
MVKPEKLDTESISARHLFYVVGLLGTAGLAFALLRIVLPLLQVILPLGMGWWLWTRWQKRIKKQQDSLDAAFYEFLQAHQGQITVLDFAMTAQLPASIAREYLDSKAREFAAHYEVTERGDVYYWFPTLKSPRFQAEERSPILQKTPLLDEQTISPTRSLTQAELARRLGVSAGAIRRRKLSTDLAEWSQSRDPDGVRWVYLAQTRRFFPLER